MKILILNWRDITHPQSGGAENFVHELGKRLAASHEVTLFCARYPHALKEEVIDGIHIQRMGNRFSVYLRAALAFRKNYYDLVIDDITGVPFFSSLYADAKVIPVIHHLLEKEVFQHELSSVLGQIGYTLQALIPRTYRQQQFIVVSESTQRDVADKFKIPLSRLKVVHCGVSIDKAALQLKSKTPLISYVGRIKSYKRIDDILRAFALILKQQPAVRLIIAGRGDVRSLRQLAEELSISAYVDFRGEVSEQEKAQILSSSWLSMMTSIKEGWGIGPMEANACGTPVVGYDVPGIRDSMQHGHTAIMVTDGCVEELAEAALYLLQHEDERQRMSQEASAWAARFTWDDTAQDFLAVISAAAPGSGPQGSDPPLHI